MKKEIFRKIKRLFDFKIGDLLSIDCSRSWASMLGFFVVVNLIIVLLNLYLYVKIDKGEVFIISETEIEKVDVGRINRRVLSETIGNFDEKTEKFEELLDFGKTDIVDPSL